MLSHTNSLFTRTLLILIPFIAIVVGLFTALLFESITDTEDYIVGDYLQKEYENIVQALATDEQSTANTNNHFNVYKSGDSQLPEYYQGLPEGLHELSDGNTHVLVDVLPDQNQRIYIELREEFHSSIEEYENILAGRFLLIALVVVFIGSLVALFIARMIVRPVIALANEVSRDSTTSTPYYGYERSDEIGALSQSLTALVNRLHKVLDREKAFTRHTSHELRTPVAVITNALAVLQLPTCNDEKRNRNLDRIQRANKQIEDLIEVFLRLGKNSRDVEQNAYRLEPLINKLLIRFSNLIEERSFVVQKRLISTAAVNASPGMLWVLLHNLLLNAFTHGESTLTISYNGKSLELSNMIGMAESADNNYQYGLEVVERICQHQGWRLAIEENSTRFRVSIMFQQ